MLSYLTAFIFYTLAMVGIMFVAVFVYKKMNITTKNDIKGTIKIIDSCPIGAKKTLLVVQIKNEKFLIASGMEHTTFLAKLDDDIQPLIQDDLKPAYDKSFDSELIEQQMAEQKVQKREQEDAYDYLYKRTQELEQRNNQYPNNVQTFAQARNSLENTKNQFRKMYSDNQFLNKKIDRALSKRELMQEILDDIHSKKVSSRGRI